jgi:hypothetical protein
VPIVHAVLPASPDLDRALAEQDRFPEAVLRADGGLASAIRQAAVGGADWVWVVDGSAIPRPSALAALLAAAERLAAAAATTPILLASRIVAGDGTLAAAHNPLAPQDRTAVAVRTAASRVLHVRAVSGGSLLVRADVAAALPPAGSAPSAMLAWTARMLRDGEGFLVPDSVALARRPDASLVLRTRVVTRLLLGSALRPRERLRLAAGLFERGRDVAA